MWSATYENDRQLTNRPSSGRNTRSCQASPSGTSRIGSASAAKHKPPLIVGQSNGADLTVTDLTGAILTDADLSSAVLGGTTLTGADLTGVTLDGATFVGVVWDASTRRPNGYEPPPQP